MAHNNILPPGIACICSAIKLYILVQVSFPCSITESVRLGGGAALMLGRGCCISDI